METLVHGGDVYGLAREYTGPILDFSANISPLGMPRGVREAAERSLWDCHQYPDPLCRDLREALSRRFGVKMEEVLCGNGAADLIFRMALALRPRCAMVPMPAFAEYAQALETVGCRVLPHFLREEEGFSLTDSILEKLGPGVDLLCLCNPNNPTGQVIPPDLLREILTRCRDRGIRVLLDECFVPFLDDPLENTLIKSLGEFPNLLILRAFTKLYAMAGLRLGFCLSSDRKLLAGMARCAQPWAVSLPAQAAGIAALGEEEYVQRVRHLIRTEREFLWDGLAELGMKPVGSRANYLFFQSPRRDLAQRLRREGILLRDCSNYPGLTPGWYRSAVRTRGENELLLKAIRRLEEPV